MAATCARFIAIQRQNTPRSHIPTPREIHQSLDRSRFIFRLSVFVFSRASVFRVRTSSLVHGRSFLIAFFAISVPHAAAGR
jgi:hypothetical protein